MSSPENCPPGCSHVTFHYCGEATHCDRHCTRGCQPCRDERARLGSIGPHFFTLAPAEQAYRIVVFADALWESNNDLSLKSFGSAIRLALRSMAPGGKFPGVIRVRPTNVLIETGDYCISSAPEGTFIAGQ